MTTVDLTLSKSVRKAASQRTGIPEANIAVLETHVMTNRHPLANLAELLIQSVVDARAKARELRVEFGQTRREGVAFCSRYLMKDGSVAWNPGFQNPDVVRPAAESDHAVPILLFRDPSSGRPVAAFTSFILGMCTLGGSEGCYCSAEWPHWLELALRRTLGEQFCNIFATGAASDFNHFDLSRPGPQMGIKAAALPIG
jgi:hypothetical protein